MKDYMLTLIRSGNSYALRAPKQYIDDSNLKVGDKVPAPKLEPAVGKRQDRAKIQKIIAELQAIEVPDGGRGLRAIKDPVAWQREIRKDRPLPGRDY